MLFQGLLKHAQVTSGLEEDSVCRLLRKCSASIFLLSCREEGMTLGLLLISSYGSTVPEKKQLVTNYRPKGIRHRVCGEFITSMTIPVSKCPKAYRNLQCCKTIKINIPNIIKVFPIIFS